MTPPTLTLPDLAAGLDDLGDRYYALGVFADDVVEVQQLERGDVPSGLASLDPEGHRFAYVHQGTTLVLEVGRDGVVQLRRPADSLSASHFGPTSNSHAAEAIRTAQIKKGRGWPFGLVLGLLSGGPLGPSKITRHVFTMRFEPETREWLGYDGGLLRWMKSELLHVA